MAKKSMRRFMPVKKYEHSYSGVPAHGRGKVELFIRCQPVLIIRKEMTVLARLMTYARHYKFSYRMTATRWVMVWPTFEVEFMSAAEMVKFVESVG